MDAHGWYLLPGVIDPHVHFGLKSRGTVAADDYANASASAAMVGGVTTVIDYADHLSRGTLADSARARMEEIQGRSFVDWALHQNVTWVEDGFQQEIEELRALGVSSLKCFTTYREAGYMLAEDDLSYVVKKAGRAGMLTTVHAEDDAILDAARAAAYSMNDRAPGAHGRCRPVQAEVTAVERVIAAAARAGGPVYIVHVSTAGAARAIAAARGRGQEVYAETCPHYLVLDEGAYEREDASLFIMSPPLRGQEHGQALWEAAAAGDIDCISTDHCAYTVEQKRAGRSCLDVLPGIPGVQASLPLVYSYGVAQGRISLSRMAELMCEAPARLFGLARKGRIEPGFDADMVLFERCPPYALSAEALGSAAGYTPYEGMDAVCRVRRTFLRGSAVTADGHPRGEFVAADRMEDAD